MALEGGGPLRRLAWITVLVLPVLAAHVRSVAASSGPGPATLCSLVPWPDDRQPGVTALVAVARPDTVRAGAGGERYFLGEGHWGRARRTREIYGQVVVVDSLEGAGTALVEAVFLQRGVREAVVVPWDYNAACETTLWARSFRWVHGESPGFYTVTLRQREFWAGERPTFDAFAADFDAYPHGLYHQLGPSVRQFGRDSGAVRDTPLSAAQLYTLYRALPTTEELSRDRVAALTRFRSWLLARPGWRTRWPADEILASVGWRLENGW
jgi:hypothetical protein